MNSRTSGVMQTPAFNRLENNVYLYITHEEIHGRKATVGEFNRLLSQMNIHLILRLVTSINNMVADQEWSDPEKSQIFQAKLVGDLCSKETRLKIAESSLANDFKVVMYHRQQQLYILRHALAYSIPEGGMEWGKEMFHAFSEACLMVNDLLTAGREVQPGEDPNLVMAHMLSPLEEINSDFEPLRVIGRASRLWLEIPEEEALRRRSDYVPIAARFEEVYGIGLQHFMRILYLLYAQSQSGTSETGEPWAKYVVEIGKFFSRTRHNREAVKKALAVISCPLEKLGTILYEERPISVKYDFTALQRYPAIEVAQDMFLLYDRKFLIEFFTSGIWWRIHDALSPQEQSNFRSFFGRVYETYLERALRHVCAEPPSRIGQRFHVPVRFSGSAEAADALIETPDAWVLMEFKASLLTTRAKYSGDLNVFKMEIDDRFVVKNNVPKGVGQLAHSIKKLAGGEELTNRALDPKRCKLIYPVLVSYDKAVSGRSVTAYLNGRFQEALGELPPEFPKVMPLTVIITPDVESFTSLGRRRLLPHLLASYRMYAPPLISFKDYILGKYRFEIDVDGSYPMGNYTLLHEAAEQDLLQQE